MVDLFSLAVASGSFVISMVALYLTYFHKGSLKLTRPTALFFTRDGIEGQFKIVITALLYSTAKRGQVVESMFIKLIRDGSTTTFGEWIYWEGSKVHLGGVKVGEEGRSLFDHFILSDDDKNFNFTSGKYLLEIYASQVGNKRPIRLFQTEFVLDAETSETIKPQGRGFALLWNSDNQSYRIQTGSPRSHREI